MATQRAAAAGTIQAPDVSRESGRRLFTVDEYYQMAEVGILKENDRVELIEGEIIKMSPIGRRHVSSVILLTRLLTRQLLDGAELSVQNPVRLTAWCEPEPDFAVLRRQEGETRPYALGHPGPSDVLLLVEVAETSVTYDLGHKADVYARHAIPELWVVDLPGDRLVVHREPTPAGYASVTVVGRGDLVSALAFPDISFTADEILG